GGAFPAGGSEEFAAQRVEHDSRDKRPGISERDGNGEARIAVGEIGGAVERVHIPAKAGVQGLAAAFFGMAGVMGEEFLQMTDDKFFRTAVGLRDRKSTRLNSSHV